MQFLPNLTQAVRKAPDFKGALSVALDRICGFTNLDYGEAWVPSKDGTILKLSPASYINTDRSKARILALEQFWLCSQAFILSPGIGLPGRVWKSQQPEWICDVSAHSETYFLRHYIAKAFGVKTGFGVPILANHQVLAVLVFFMSSVCAEDKRLVDLVTAATTPLGERCHAS